MKMQKSTFNILFYMRQNRVDREGKKGIMVRITVCGEQCQFFSKISVVPEDWDAAKCRVKGRTAAAIETNRRLDEIKASLISHYNDIERREGVVTAEKLRNAYQGIEDRTETLIAVFRRYVGNGKKLIGISKSKATMQKYERCCNRLEDFLKVRYKLSDIAFKEIKYEFLIDFESYLRKECGCGANTSAKFLQTFRMIVLYAKNNGMLFHDPFVNYKIRLKPVDRGFLTIEEIQKIATKETANKSLSKIRDIFLFS